jgi:hypothetical protein
MEAMVVLWQDKAETVHLLCKKALCKYRARLQRIQLFDRGKSL